MNEIITSASQFEFILKTDISNLGELGIFLSAIYNDSFEQLEVFEDQDNIPPLAEYIPTKAMIMDEADRIFSEHYYHYIKNGHCEGCWEESFIEEEEDDDGIYDVIARMNEWRYNSTSFYMGLQEGAPELLYIRDVVRGLHLFHMTYLDDCKNDDVYHKKMGSIEWINKPIIKVW